MIHGVGTKKVVQKFLIHFSLVNTITKHGLLNDHGTFPYLGVDTLKSQSFGVESPTGLGLSLDQRMEIPLLTILAYKGYSFHNLAINSDKFSFFTLTRFVGVPINSFSIALAFRNKIPKLGVHFLLTAYSSNIYFAYKISIGYQITSNFNENLLSDSSRCLLTFSEKRNITMISQKSYKPAYLNLP